MVVVVIGGPLLLAQRVECRQGGVVQDEWSVRIPFGVDRVPSNCSNPQSGAEHLLDLVSGE